jgi:hypothetical protein
LPDPLQGSMYVPYFVHSVVCWRIILLLVGVPRYTQSDNKINLNGKKDEISGGGQLMDNIQYLHRTSVMFEV